MYAGKATHIHGMKELQKSMARYSAISPMMATAIQQVLVVSRILSDHQLVVLVAAPHSSSEV